MHKTRSATTSKVAGPRWRHRAAGKIRPARVPFLMTESSSHWAAAKRKLLRSGRATAVFVFVRGIERDVLPVCARYGMGVFVWGPLNSGWLTGKYARGQELPQGSRAQRWSANQAKNWNDERSPVQRKHDLVDALSAVALEAGLSLTHLAMAFSHEHPAVTSRSWRARWSNSTTCWLRPMSPRHGHARCIRCSRNRRGQRRTIQTEEDRARITILPAPR